MSTHKKGDHAADSDLHVESKFTVASDLHINGSSIEHDGEYFVAFDKRGQWLGDFLTCEEALAAVADAKERVR